MSNNNNREHKRLMNLLQLFVNLDKRLVELSKRYDNNPLSLTDDEMTEMFNRYNRAMHNLREYMHNTKSIKEYAIQEEE